MKRREKKLSVMDWVLVGLLDTLAGVVAGGLMAIWQLPSAYRWRGYWAIGGEWLLVIIAIIMAVRLTHAFQMFMIFGAIEAGYGAKCYAKEFGKKLKSPARPRKGKTATQPKSTAERQIIGQLTVYDILAAHEKSADQNGQRATNG